MNTLLADPTLQSILLGAGGYLLAALKLRFPSLPLPTPAPVPQPGPLLPPPQPAPGPAPVPADPLVRVASFSDPALEQLRAALAPKP